MKFPQFEILWLGTILLELCVAHPFLLRERSALPTIRQLVEFPNVTWVENLAVRSNGQLLVTIFTSPELYQIDPFQPGAAPTLISTFPDALGILGIAEIEHDVFAIASGNLSASTGLVDPESAAVWKIDLQGQQPVLSKITDIPGATLLNGLTTVEEGSNFILIADSIGGVIWRVNLETAVYDVVLNDTATQPMAPFAQGGFGVNGVHTRDGFLYFTNTNLGFMRVPIDTDGMPTGDVEALASFPGGDDFTFDGQGDAYIARGRFDAIDEFTQAGAVNALNYTNPDALVLIEGNTAMQFGRTKCDFDTLYVTTNGGLSGLVNETMIQGGRVLAIGLGGSTWSAFGC